MTRIATLFFFLSCITSCQNKTPDTPPVLSPTEALSDFQLPDGFTAEIVAAEPLIEAPVALSFDENADCWVVEMRSYMPDENGLGEDAPTGRIKILRDTNRDGTMDQAHIFLDSLVLPRAVCPVYGGVLVAEPPALWFYKRRGDQAGSRILVDSAFAEGHNPEHQANSLTLGMDNWIYAARCEKRYRRDNTGAWRIEKAHFRGQWGMAQDDFGRLYYNDNSTILTGDNLPPSAWPLLALSVSPVVGNNFGVRYGTNRVFPRRSTPGVNRGYQEGVLDRTQRLVNATSACGPTIFRGDNFSVKDASEVPVPADGAQFLAFVPEAAAHLVKCVVLTHSPEGISGLPDREGIDFLTATDERFRPVNAYTAPDGTLWLADFHRGLIQHATYLTPYLREQVRAKNLLPPTHLGRIFRIRKTKNPPQPCQSLGSLSTAQLVNLLAHPNGWRRDKAQWLLVERGDTSVAPLLREMALRHTDPRARLHALWTLDGLGTAIPGFLKTVFDNSNHAEVARLAIRLCAPNDLAAFKQLFEIAGAAEAVHFAAVAPAFCQQHAEGIRPVLQKIATTQAADTLCAAVFAGAFWKNCSLEQVGVWRRFFAQKGVPIASVLMQYLEKSPETEPQSSDPVVAKLSVPDLELYHEGRGLYETYCAACHGKSGEGIPNLAPPLVQSGWVNAVDKSIPIRIVLDGLEGPVTVAGKPYTLPGVMIGMRENMATNNGTIAKIITYIRNSWGNDAGAIQVWEVGQVHEATKDRKNPYKAGKLLPDGIEPEAMGQKPAVSIPKINTAPDRKAQAASSPPWRKLFDGKTLRGWHQIGGTAPYTVQDGSIVGTTVPGTQNSFLITENRYADFVLELEFRADSSLNSGIQIRSNHFPDYKQDVFHGYQIEIDPTSRAWSGGVYDESRRGWLFKLEGKPEAQRAYRKNDWNHYRIEAIGNRIRTWVNGIPVADLTDGLTRCGHIGLQVHHIGQDSSKAGRTIAWRNIRLRDLGGMAWSASLETPEHPVNALFDGVPASIWQGNWLTLDFRKNKRLKTLLLDLPKGEAQDIQIAIATERTPEKWTVVFDGSLSAKPEGAQVSMDKKVARYVRFSGKGKALVLGEVKAE